MPLHKKTSQLSRDFIKITSNIADAAGQDYLLGVIFGILFLQDKEIAMEELAKQCGYSLASVSQKIKIIEQFGIIKKSTRPGSRKIYLSMEKDLLNVWLKQIYSVGEKKIKVAREQLPLLLAAYKNKLMTEEDKRVYQIIKKYHQQIILFDKILRDFAKIIQTYTNHK